MWSVLTRLFRLMVSFFLMEGSGPHPRPAPLREARLHRISGTGRSELPDEVLVCEVRADGRGRVRELALDCPWGRLRLPVVAAQAVGATRTIYETPSLSGVGAKLVEERAGAVTSWSLLITETRPGRAPGGRRRPARSLFQGVLQGSA